MSETDDPGLDPERLRELESTSGYIRTRGYVERASSDSTRVIIAAYTGVAESLAGYRSRESTSVVQIELYSRSDRQAGRAYVLVAIPIRCAIELKAPVGIREIKILA